MSRGVHDAEWSCHSNSCSRATAASVSTIAAAASTIALNVVGLLLPNDVDTQNVYSKPVTSIADIKYYMKEIINERKASDIITNIAQRFCFL